jgi:hypothetical protein
MPLLDKPIGQEQELEQGNYRISSKALELLQCFMAGLDDVIIRIALEKARARAATPQDVRIDADDIVQAADAVLERIQSQENLPAELRADINEMDGCLKAKCRELL